MMEREALIAALKDAVVEAFEIIDEAFADDLQRDLYQPIAYGHVLSALIQDIHDAEAAR